MVVYGSKDKWILGRVALQIFAERLFLASFFRLSQCPGIVAVWYNHPKSSPVGSGCHFMVRYDTDQDLGLFQPKQHWPHC